jgi:hypothetical protein
MKMLFNLKLKKSDLNDLNKNNIKRSSEIPSKMSQVNQTIQFTFQNKLTTKVMFHDFCFETHL